MSELKHSSEYMAGLLQHAENELAQAKRDIGIANERIRTENSCRIHAEECNIRLAHENHALERDLAAERHAHKLTDESYCIVRDALNREREKYRDEVNSLRRDLADARAENAELRADNERMSNLLARGIRTRSKGDVYDQNQELKLARAERFPDELRELAQSMKLELAAAGKHTLGKIHSDALVSKAMKLESALADGGEDVEG